jgi:hypothetical protein
VGMGRGDSLQILTSIVGMAAGVVTMLGHFSISDNGGGRLGSDIVSTEHVVAIYQCKH